MDDTYTVHTANGDLYITINETQYLNLTKLLKKHHKNTGIMRTKQTKAFIQVLESEGHIAYVILRNVRNEHRGTYVHPTLLTHILCKLSIETSYNVMKSQTSDSIEKLTESFVPDKRNYVEKQVQKWLAELVNGEMEVKTDAGNIDILTSTEIIETKLAHDWKSAIGQLIAYQSFYPNHTKHMYLIGNSKNKDIINKVCATSNIKVTFHPSSVI